MKRALFLIAVLGGLASVANFAFQILTASRLTPGAFSLFAAMLTIIIAIGAGSTGFQIVTARSVSTKIDWSPEKRLIDKTTRHGVVASIALLLLLLPLSPILARAIRVDPYVVALLLLFLPISVMQSLAIGRIQGSGQVVRVAGIGLALAAMKLLAGAVVLYLGGGAVALVGSLLVSNAVVLAAIMRYARQTGSCTSSIISKLTITLFVAQISYWSLISLDILIARVALPEDLAGQFAAAATLAKIVLFLPAMLTTALLPWAGRRVGMASSRRRMALVSLVGTLAVSTVTSIFLLVSASWMVETLFGLRYEDAAQYVGPLAFAYIPLTLTGVVLQFHFTSKRSVYAATNVIALLIAAVLVILGPPIPMFYISVIAAVGTVQVIALLVEAFLFPSEVTDDPMQADPITN